MKITLATPEQHEKLWGIYNEYPGLTLQNKGYEYLKNLTDEEMSKIKEVEEILKYVVHGFKKFNNFRISDKSKEIQVRLQYDYNYDNIGLPFTGVGYIDIDELLNGFKEN